MCLSRNNESRAPRILVFRHHALAVIIRNEPNISVQAWVPHVKYGVLYLVVLGNCTLRALESIASFILKSWFFFIVQGQKFGTLCYCYSQAWKIFQTQLEKWFTVHKKLRWTINVVSTYLPFPFVFYNLFWFWTTSWRHLAFLWCLFSGLHLFLLTFFRRY